MTDDTSTTTINSDEAGSGPLDLSRPVSRDRYMNTITGLYQFFEGELKPRNSWCNERFRYFEELIPELVVDRSNRHYTAELDFTSVPEDADYVARLRDTRGKLLWYASSTIISLSQTNEALQAAGMPGYKAENSGTRMSLELDNIRITVAASTSNEARVWIQDHLTDFLTRMIDGKGPMDTDLYVPGSITFGDPEYIHTASLPSVDVKDTIRPGFIG
jgi:hypothetical protein